MLFIVSLYKLSDAGKAGRAIGGMGIASLQQIQATQFSLAQTPVCACVNEG